MTVLLRVAKVALSYEAKLLTKAQSSIRRMYFSDMWGWSIGGWGTCNPSNCPNSGTQTRSVTCVDARGDTLPDTSCFSSKPATSQGCTPSCSYAWQTGSWGAKSYTCNKTNPDDCTQTRSVWCMCTNNSVTVDNSYCGGGMPATSQSCNGTVTCRSRAYYLYLKGVAAGYTCTNIISPFYSPSCTLVTTYTFFTSWDGSDLLTMGYKNSGTTQCSFNTGSGAWVYTSPWNTVMGSYASVGSCSSTYTLVVTGENYGITWTL